RETEEADHKCETQCDGRQSSATCRPPLTQPLARGPPALMIPIRKQCISGASDEFMLLACERQRGLIARTMIKIASLRDEQAQIDDALVEIQVTACGFTISVSCNDLREAVVRQRAEPVTFNNETDTWRGEHLKGAFAARIEHLNKRSPGQTRTATSRLVGEMPQAE